MTFFKIHYLLIVLFFTPLIIFQTDFAYADPPEPVSFTSVQITPTTLPLNATIVIPDVVVGTELDRLLLVGVSMDNRAVTGVGEADVFSVNFGPSGSNCSVNHSFTPVPGSVSNQPNTVQNEIWSFTTPTQSQTCDVIVVLTESVGDYGPFFEKRSASVSAAYFSGVDQTTPIEGNAGQISVGSSDAPSLSIVGSNTADHLVMDIMSSNSGLGSAPIQGADQILQFSYVTGGVVNFLMGTSTQLGGVLNPMSWSTAPNAGVWASSAVVIRSCDISSSCAVVSGPTSGSGCSGDCTAPTLGIDKSNNLVVKNGFSFNDNPSDVELHFTPFELISTTVGKENILSLVLYEDSGPQNIAHVGIAFGLSDGESFGKSNVVINWDRTFDGIETISLFDPDNILENVSADIEEKTCELISSQCLHITIYHTFRAPMEFNMVSTNVWDHDRNAWQNYFNHGIQITGDSLNPPKEYVGHYKGKLYTLTETQKNQSIDDDGNTWTFNYGIWNRDYVHVEKFDSSLINFEKIQAIKHVLKDKSFDDIQSAFGYTRNHNTFVIQQDYQILLAESLLEEICPRCSDEPYDKIDDIFYYEIPEITERIDSELKQTMVMESEKAENIVMNMMNYTHTVQFD